MSKQREALHISLKALEQYGTSCLNKEEAYSAAIKTIREALAESEKTNQCGETCERAKLCAVCAGGVIKNEQEPKLEFWPGDVLICKEDDTKVTVVHGNRGPLQLMNGKISIAWSDTVGGEYTIEQIKEMFYRAEELEPKPLAHHSEDGLDMVKARQIACEYPQPNSNIDSGNLYWALHVALRHSAQPTKADRDHFGDVTEMATRKPLTDAEMRQCANAMGAEPLSEGWKELIKFARAIERAHGIG